MNGPTAPAVGRPVPVWPPAVPEGGRLVVVSPSGPAAAHFPNRLQRGIDVLRSAGFDVREARGARADAGTTAGSAQQRLEDLHEAFADPQVRGVMCSIGGRLSIQLLDGLDLDLIRDNPKFFSGYSDVTTLHCAMGAATGLTTFYGTVVMPGLGELPAPDPDTLNGLVSALHGPMAHRHLVMPASEVVERVGWNQDRPRLRRPSSPHVVLRPGHASGFLVAACLPVLTQLIGTPYLPDLRGAALWLETPEGPYGPAEVSRDLWHMRLAGLFDDVVGVTIGRPHLCTSADELGRIFDDTLPPDLAPVVFGVPVGHGYPNLTVPIGADVRLTHEGLMVVDGGVRLPE